jgi:sugar transferase (PEP-CTERM/EpsH1 system associated)
MGGMENGLVNLINQMPEDQYRHAIACVEDASDFAARIRRSDVRIATLQRSQVGVWGLRRALYRLCRELRPRIVHSRNLSGLDALLAARVARVPRIVHGEHGWDVDDLQGRGWRPALLRRLHAPLVDRYITVSVHLKRYLESRVGISADRITQIYNGVDTQRFTPQGGKLTHAPRHLADGKRLWFGTAGRLQEVKDHTTLLRAYADALKERPDLKSTTALALFGDGPLLDTLRRMANELGIGDLTWFAGATDDMPSAMRSLDVFVLPSLNEGVSNTLLEAMATGLPVLATSVGGNVELVDDPTTGRLFAPRDHPDLTRLMLQQIDHPAQRLRQGQAARQRSLDEFSLAAMVSGYASVYDQLLAS